MPSSRRTASTVAALVLLAAEATGMFHLLVAPHETCPVDGQLVERLPGPAADGARARPERLTQSRVARGGSCHAHDRCLATPGELEGVPTSPVAPAPLALESRPLRSVLRAWAAPTGPPLYHVAPKTSPPA
jgi:hypothetical protein